MTRRKSQIETESDADDEATERLVGPLDAEESQPCEPVANNSALRPAAKSLKPNRRQEPIELQRICQQECAKFDQQASEEIMTLNLRGERIYMPVSELKQFYYPLYRKLMGEDQSHFIPCVEFPNGEKYFNADATVFRLLLSYFRYKVVHLPSYICGPMLEGEMDFWGVKIKPQALQACCMHNALDSKRWKVLLDEFEHKALAAPVDDSLIGLPGGPSCCLSGLWNLLSNPCSSFPSGVYALVMITCSLTSAVLYTMEPPDPCSDWGYRNSAPANCTKDSLTADLNYVAAQCAFTVLFTLDLILRALLTPNRAKFVRSAHTWNDVLSLVPLYGFLLHRMTGHRIDLRSPTGWLFELLSMALFFRTFRILRHFMGIRVMAYTLLTGLSDLMVVMLLVFTATFLFGTVFFLMERSSAENREKVPTMFHGYYWAVITITTVGYGDITPSTVEGRILAILCSLVGLIVVAFTVPIMTENFQRYYGHTCHVSMKGEMGNFVLRVKRWLRRIKRRIVYSSC